MKIHSLGDKWRQPLHFSFSSFFSTAEPVPCVRLPSQLRSPLLRLLKILPAALAKQRCQLLYLLFLACRKPNNDLSLRQRPSPNAIVGSFRSKLPSLFTHLKIDLGLAKPPVLKDTHWVLNLWRPSKFALGMACLHSPAQALTIATSSSLWPLAITSPIQAVVVQNLCFFLATRKLFSIPRSPSHPELHVGLLISAAGSRPRDCLQ